MANNEPSAQDILDVLSGEFAVKGGVQDSAALDAIINAGAGPTVDPDLPDPYGLPQSVADQSLQRYGRPESNPFTRIGGALIEPAMKTQFGLPQEFYGLFHGKNALLNSFNDIVAGGAASSVFTALQGLGAGAEGAINAMGQAAVEAGLMNPDDAQRFARDVNGMLEITPAFFGNLPPALQGQPVSEVGAARMASRYAPERPPAFAIEAQSQRVPIPVTKGDVTQNVNIQRFEDEALKGVYGDPAQQRIENLRTQQSDALRANVEEQQKAMTGRGTALEQEEAGLGAERVGGEIKDIAKAHKDNIRAAYDAAKRSDAGVNAGLVKDFVKTERQYFAEEGFDIEDMPMLAKSLDRLDTLSSRKPDLSKTKIVGDDGKPLVVYHQTSRGAAKSIEGQGFRLDKPRARETDPILPDGVFFKPDTRNIGVGTMVDEDIAQVPVVLDIKRPAVFKNREEFRAFIDDPEYRALVKRSDEIDRETARLADAELAKPTPSDDREAKAFFESIDTILAKGRAEDAKVSGKARSKATAFLRSRGYDGIIIESDVGSMGRATKTYVALDPKQVYPADGALTPASIKELELVRKQITKRAQSLVTQDPSQAEALRQLKAHLDKYQSDLLDQSLIRGDENAVNLWRQARDLRADFGRRFNDSDVITKIMDENLTQEETVNLLFGGSKMGFGTKAGSIVKQVKAVVGEDSQAFRALKEEAFLRLFKNQDGGANFSGVKFEKAFTKAMQDNPTMMRELFTADEIAEIRQLARIARTITDKKPGAVNHSNTFISAMAQRSKTRTAIRQGVRKVTEKQPFFSEYIKEMWKKSDERHAKNIIVDYITLREDAAPWRVKEPDVLAIALETAALTHERQ